MTSARRVKKCRFDNIGRYFSAGRTGIINTEMKMRRFIGEVEKHMLEFGKLIRQLRKQQKMTQKVLASGIVSESVMSRIENGVTEPGLVTLNKLLQRLGKTLHPFEFVVSNREYEALKRNRDKAAMGTIVIAEGDYFKDIREATGLSQEKFSSDVYARETISNIEHGRTPQRKKIQDVLEKQGLDFKKYYGYVVAAEYETYELVEQYRELLLAGREESAAVLLRIREKLDKSNPVNLQFLESSELMEKRRKNGITIGEELAGLEKCLRYTMPEYDGFIYRIPYRQESTILEEMIACMKELQRTEAAQYLAGELVKKNEKKLKLS